MSLRLFRSRQPTIAYDSSGLAGSGWRELRGLHRAENVDAVRFNAHIDATATGDRQVG